jgi:hypothetical protein
MNQDRNPQPRRNNTGRYVEHRAYELEFAHRLDALKLRVDTVAAALAKRSTEGTNS